MESNIQNHSAASAAASKNTISVINKINNNNANDNDSKIKICHRLKVEKVHAQMIFTSEMKENDEKINSNDTSSSSSISQIRSHRDQQKKKDDFILIDFMEAVRGLRLFCADLTDYVKVGDKCSVETIVSENGIRYGKSAKFDFDVDTRGFSDDSSSLLSSPNKSDYFKGVGIVEHVGDWYAGVQAREASSNPAVRDLLMPITALTKDSVPVGQHLSQLRLTDLVKKGDQLIYKVPRYSIDDVSFTSFFWGSLLAIFSAVFLAFFLTHVFFILRGPTFGL